jgi:hypothetical protein
MYHFDVTSALLITLVAGALALAFDYFPGLAKWFDGKPLEFKRLINAGSILLVAAVLFAGQCLAIFATNLVCNLKGGFDLLYLVFIAIATNQGVHFALRPSKRFKARMFRLPK